MSFRSDPFVCVFIVYSCHYGSWRQPLKVIAIRMNEFKWSIVSCSVYLTPLLHHPLQVTAHENVYNFCAGIRELINALCTRSVDDDGYG